MSPAVQLDLAARFQGPLLVFFARRTRDHALAQDLTQETLLRVLGAQRSTEVEKPESYVFTVAMNLLRDRRRSRLKSAPPVFVPIEEAAASELERQLTEDLSPERVLLSKESLNDVWRTLSELGERTDVIATGGLAGLVVPYAEEIENVDQLLTLTGLRLLHERNV